ncbi:dual specificity phosphatase [Fomes fomentarius]|nr:dual specificity phosphatase [Fomes fomentarius]
MSLHCASKLGSSVMVSLCMHCKRGPYERHIARSVQLHLSSPSLIRAAGGRQANLVMISFTDLPSEVMEAMCIPMHLILSASPQQHTGALYLGSFTAILDPALLTSHQIQAVVQILESPWLPSVEAHAAQGNELECCRLNISDSTSTDLHPHLESTVHWIDDKLRRGINVLVHCQQGISRSASIVIAYLIYTHNMSYDFAFDFVKRKRACIKPNSSFVRCLQEWEQQRPLALQRPKLRRASATTAWPTARIAPLVVPGKV